MMPLGLSHLTIFDMDGDNVSEVVLDLSFFSREWMNFHKRVLNQNFPTNNNEQFT